MIYSDTDFNNKTVLITGGAGFIGSNLAFYFQKQFPSSRIVIFDCFRNDEKFTNGNLKSFGHYKNLIGFKGEIICGNIDNKEDLEQLESYKFDYIFHHAAISDTRVYDQESVFRTNINSFDFFLKLGLQNSAPLIYASSAATYGNLPSPQMIGIENPENPYGYSKYIMDQMAIQFSKKHPNMTIVGLRFFNVYGDGEFYKNKTSSMIIQIGHQLLSGNKPKLFFNSENIKRDFVYIDDVTQSNIKAAVANKSGIYNVGTGIPRSFTDIVEILQDKLKTNLDIEFINNPYSGYQNHTQADISLSEKYLDFHPQFSLEEGIEKYIPYIKSTHNSQPL